MNLQDITCINADFFTTPNRVIQEDIDIFRNEWPQHVIARKACITQSINKPRQKDKLQKMLKTLNVSTEVFNLIRNANNTRLTRNKIKL